jgi:outer membrane biogenesis lipoprotein LolB
MRTHIFLLALTALLTTACASKEHLTQSDYQQQQQQEDHYSFLESQASRVR